MTAGISARPVVKILLSDSTEVVCPFASEPRFDFVDGQLRLTSSEQTGAWAFADVDSWTLADEDVSGINVAASGRDAAAVRIRISGGAVCASGATDFALRVYSPNGTLLREVKAGADGQAAVEISALPPGVSVITAGRETLKIVRR